MLKKALISPNEKIKNNDDIIIGLRIAEVSNNIFEVASPLYWIDCDDTIKSAEYCYDENTNTFVKIPERPNPYIVPTININFDDLF